MPASLQIPSSVGAVQRQTRRSCNDVQWWREVPWYLKDLVVPPVQFLIHQEYEIQADRTLGHDQWDAACYCAFRYVQRQLHAADCDPTPVAPVYAQTMDAWRLVDGNWLVLTRTFADFDSGHFQSDLTIHPTMPR